MAKRPNERYLNSFSRFIVDFLVRKYSYKAAKIINSFLYFSLVITIFAKQYCKLYEKDTCNQRP